MATVTVGITRGRTVSAGVTRVPAAGGSQPVAKLRTADVVLELPYAPRKASLGGMAGQYETVPRPGREPVTVPVGGPLNTLSLTVFLGFPDHQQSVEPLIAALRQIAEARDRVTLANLSVQERGPWHLTGCDVEVDLRQAGTNHATRATASLTFTAATAVTIKLGPVSGGKSRGGKGGKGDKGAQRYTVRAGDTLAKIAGMERHYGDPSKWRLIAQANKITRPDSIKPGDVLVIPKDD